MTPFENAYDEIAAYDPSAGRPSKTIILPPASRGARVGDPKLDAKLYELIERDIGLQRIGGGGWDQKGVNHSVMSQLWVGAGAMGESLGTNQGTGWHCDICNNFVVHVTGQKKWTFVHPKFSHLMRPTMKTGKTAAIGTDLSFRTEVLPFIERSELVVSPGDFFYNPDFYWHSVKNAPGMTVAIVARECNITNSFRAQPVLATTVVLNHVRAALFGGDSYARARLWSAMPKFLTGGTKETNLAEAPEGYKKEGYSV